MSRWTEAIAQNTEDFQAAFAGMSYAQLNWCPSPQVWSIGQNLDHLIVINHSYFPLISALQAGTYQVPWLGRIRPLANWMGRMILDTVRPEQSRKTRTFPVWEPSQSEIAADILIRFEKHQAELIDMINSAEDFAEQGAIIHSPANRNIVYRLVTAFDIIITHERRHLAQALAVKEMLPTDLAEAG